MKQKIDVVSENELQWIASQFESGVRFVEAFSPSDSGRSLTLAALDRAFGAWMSAESFEDAQLINNIINYVGVAFGRLLVEGIGFKWVIATDEHGSDLAVHALPGKGDVLIYPTNFVAKRWERRETNFLESAYHQIAKQVQEVTRRYQD